MDFGVHVLHGYETMCVLLLEQLAALKYVENTVDFKDRPVANEDKEEPPS